MSNANVDTKDREIVQSRLIHAPRELVFEAWTNPEHFNQWFGPNGFTTTVHEMNIRQGGSIRFTMRAPDGTDFHDRITFTEIVKNERLAYEHGNDIDNDPDSFQVVVTFEAFGDKTKLTMRSLFKTAAALVAVKKFGAVELGKQTLTKLEDLLYDSLFSDRMIRSTRVLNAPRELVYEAWTTEKHIKKWWGPTGFTNEFSEYNPTVGGTWKFVMIGPDGKTYKNESRYVELLKPWRIVMEHVSGPHYLMITTFDDLGDKTKLTWRMIFETATIFNNIKGVAIPGNEQNIDKLEVELEKMKAVTV